MMMQTDDVEPAESVTMSTNIHFLTVHFSNYPYFYMYAMQ